MPGDTILCWRSMLTPTGRVTVSDYRIWRSQGEQAKGKIVELFRVRMHERYIEPVLALDREKKNGFLIMAVSCLLIETYETFRQGWPSSDRKSALAFCYFFDRENRFREFRGHSRSFYEHVRCGILHQGETTGGWQLTREKGKPLFNQCPPTINATKFHKLLAEVIDNYCDELKAEPLTSEIWSKFERKMETTIDNCEP